MRRVFGTGIFEDMHNRPSDYAASVKREYETYKIDAARLESEFVTDVDTSKDRPLSQAARRETLKVEADKLAAQIEQVKQLNTAILQLTENTQNANY